MSNFFLKTFVSTCSYEILLQKCPLMKWKLRPDLNLGRNYLVSQSNFQLEIDLTAIWRIQKIFQHIQFERKWRIKWFFWGENKIAITKNDHVFGLHAPPTLTLPPAWTSEETGRIASNLYFVYKLFKTVKKSETIYIHYLIKVR